MRQKVKGSTCKVASSPAKFSQFCVAFLRCENLAGDEATCKVNHSQTGKNGSFLYLEQES